MIASKLKHKLFKQRKFKSYYIFQSAKVYNSYLMLVECIERDRNKI